MLAVLASFLFEGIICYVLGLPSASEEILMIASLLFLAINSVVLLLYINNHYRSYAPKVFYAIIGSLIFKIMLLLWDYYATNIFILPNSHIDSEGFHLGAIYYALHRSGRVENYSYVVGWIYRLFGVQRITAQFFNIILSFLGIEVFERVLEILGIEEKAKENALILAGLLPNYAIMSAILIRECIISVILCFSLYSFAMWWKEGKLLYLIFAVVIPLGACWFHSGSIAMSIGISVCAIISKKDNNSRRISISFGSVILSILFFVGFMYLFDALSSSLLGRFHGLETSVIDTYIDEHNIYTAKESNSSTYTAGLSGLTGWWGILINSPIRIIYFLWVPMPWDIRGMGDIIAFVGSSLFYGGSFFLAIYRMIKKEQNINQPLLLLVFILAFSGAVVFAWGVDSARSALRHREKFYFIYLLLFAVTQSVNIKESNYGVRTDRYVRS